VVYIAQVEMNNASKADYALPSVELRSVSKAYGDVMAVENLSLVIRKGEFLTLLGPSGCGKTTILRLIGGFVRADEGEVWINGRSSTDLPPFRRNVHTVFQNYSLFPHLNVQDNIAFGLRRKGVRGTELARRVAGAMELVKLTGLERRWEHELSGGQQQRVALARALANNPDVLLLDEPLAALDLKLRRAMQAELKSLQRRTGITFVFVTHDQEEALTMSDRIAVMNRGKILQVGQGREIYDRPASRFVAEFIGESSFLRGRCCGSNGPYAQVEIPGLGNLLACGEVIPPEGAEVLLAVRPEKITLEGEAGRGSGNVARGMIDTLVFRGDETEVEVSLPVGLRLKVYYMNKDATGPLPLAQGMAVTLSWQPEATRIIGE
jgi:spermidine/putrescine transport system ATP-binding protein